MFLHCQRKINRTLKLIQKGINSVGICQIKHLDESLYNYSVQLCVGFGSYVWDYLLSDGHNEMYMLNKRYLKCKIIIGKKGLNSDGHGFHHNQQKTSDQSHLIFSELTEHNM